MLACVSKGHQEGEMWHSLMFKTEDKGEELAEVLGEDFVSKVDMQDQAAARLGKGEYEVSLFKRPPAPGKPGSSSL